MKNFPWQDLNNRKINAHFIPKNGDNFDKKYCENPDKIGNDTYERYHNYYQDDNFPNIFRNYTFCNLKDINDFVEKEGPVTILNSARSIVSGKSKRLTESPVTITKKTNIISPIINKRNSGKSNFINSNFSIGLLKPQTNKINEENNSKLPFIQSKLKSSASNLMSPNPGNKSAARIISKITTLSSNSTGISSSYSIGKSLHKRSVSSLDSNSPFR